MPDNIIKAIENQDYRAFLALIKDCDVQNHRPEGMGLLHAAIFHNFPQAATYLIEKGADINAEDELGNRPLHYCADKNNLELADLLLSRGAEINVGNRIGVVPLQNVVFHARPDSLAMLPLFLNQGASPDIENNHGVSPLAFATNMGFANVIELLESHSCRSGHSQVSNIEYVNIRGSDDGPLDLG